VKNNHSSLENSFFLWITQLQVVVWRFWFILEAFWLGWSLKNSILVG